MICTYFSTKTVQLRITECFIHLIPELLIYCHILLQKMFPSLFEGELLFNNLSLTTLERNHLTHKSKTHRGITCHRCCVITEQHEAEVTARVFTADAFVISLTRLMFLLRGQNGGSIFFFFFKAPRRQYGTPSLFAVTTCCVFVKTTQALSPHDMGRGGKSMVVPASCMSFC